MASDLNESVWEGISSFRNPEKREIAADSAVSSSEEKEVFAKNALSLDLDWNSKKADRFLQKMVERGEADTLESLVKEGKLNAGRMICAVSSQFLAGRREMPLLSFAVLKNEGKIVSMFLRFGANANAQDGDGDTPLFFASSPFVVSLLVRAGADIHAVNKEGMEAVHLMDEVACVELLYRLGAKADVRDKSGKTPLHFAEKAEIAEVHLKHGADANALDNDGRSPMSYVWNEATWRKIKEYGGKVIVPKKILSRLVFQPKQYD